MMRNELPVFHKTQYGLARFVLEFSLRIQLQGAEFSHLLSPQPGHSTRVQTNRHK